MGQRRGELALHSLAERQRARRLLDQRRDAEQLDELVARLRCTARAARRRSRDPARTTRRAAGPRAAAASAPVTKARSTAGTPARGAAACNPATVASPDVGWSSLGEAAHGVADARGTRRARRGAIANERSSTATFVRPPHERAHRRDGLGEYDGRGSAARWRTEIIRSSGVERHVVVVDSPCLC